MTETSETDITGRDGYIIRQALAYAIVTIERLTETWKEASDQDDMRKLLNHLCRSGKPPAEEYLLNAAKHLEHQE